MRVYVAPQTYDEMKHVVRQKLHIKSKELSESDLKALWCVLDADDSNSIMIDELTRFLKGRPMSSPPQSPAKRPKSPSEKRAEIRKSKEEAIRQEKRDAYREAREAAHKQYMRERAERMNREAQLRVRAHAERRAGIKLGVLRDKSKKQLLDDLRKHVLRSPIPTESVERLGAGRVLTLYQSERMIAQMEQTVGRKQWPKWPRSTSPPSTPLIENLGRLEDLMTTPMLMYSSRAATPASRHGASRAAGALQQQLGFARSPSQPRLVENASMLPWSQESASRQPSQAHQMGAYTAALVEREMRSSASLPYLGK
jgi:hypothetical protein